MIEYGRVLRKRRGGLCCLQRTLNHRALGKAWGLGQRRTQRPGIWRQEKAGLSTSLWLLRCPGPPCTPGCWAPTSSSRCPCSLPRPRRRSSLCPQIHTHAQKTRPSCQAANALLQTECCFKDAFEAKKAISAICREGRERNLRAQDEVCEPGDCLSRFAEQLHLHDVRVFLFQKSAYADPSRYALPKYLGLIQGNDLDCCRWVTDPPERCRRCQGVH